MDHHQQTSFLRLLFVFVPLVPAVFWVFSCDTVPAAMEACGRAGKWNSALRLLAEVRDKGLNPDAFTLNAVMDALGR